MPAEFVELTRQTVEQAIGIPTVVQSGFLNFKIDENLIPAFEKPLKAGKRKRGAQEEESKSAAA